MSRAPASQVHPALKHLLALDAGLLLLQAVVHASQHVVRYSRADQTASFIVQLPYYAIMSALL